MVINIFLFLSLVLLFTFLIGKLIEKARVPWIFAALLIGSVLAVYNPFSDITSSETFGFFSQLGMFMLLFLIGFELNLKEVNKRKGFFVKATFFIILFEAFFGSLVVHFVFGYNWLVSGLIALSFATVGEAILIPILDEFGAINTKLGQTLIGIGTLDDIFEIITLIVAVILIGSSINTHISLQIVIFSFVLIMSITFLLFKLKGKKIGFLGNESLFLFIIAILFLFLGIGKYADISPFAALLAGVSAKGMMSKGRLKVVENGIRTFGYGFFVPIFFLSVGLEIDIGYLLAFPLLVLLVVAVANGSKLLASYIIARKELGTKGSILLGIGLSVRFSTSLVIIKLLYDSKIVGSKIYSIIIASSIVFKFLVPVLFSNLLVRWGFAKKRK